MRLSESEVVATYRCVFLSFRLINTSVVENNDKMLRNVKRIKTKQLKTLSPKEVVDLIEHYWYEHRLSSVIVRSFLMEVF